MKKSCANIYVCPFTGRSLSLEHIEGKSDNVEAGDLVVADQSNKISYKIQDGIPKFTQNESANIDSDQSREFCYYQENSEEYDKITEWVFESFSLNEKDVRESIVDLLELKPSDAVLETGCGTGRDSESILNRLGVDGSLFLQDLSDNMLDVGRRNLTDKMEQPNAPMVEFFIGDAVKLPFPDNYFDSAYHFGGINLFSDIEGAIKEMARVVRVGGKVVVGDEGMAPWLKKTEPGKILMNSHQLYRREPPISLLPENVHDVCLRWIIQNAFYIIDFKVGDQGPEVNLDLPILGSKGGTHRTRYYGQLGDVSIKAKNLATKLADEAGVSLHDWLDRTIREKENSSK
jgi:ubiquinone/menaquinone biosynthesis C-methylase UbiE